MKPIWKYRTNGGADRDKSYRQRVYHVSRKTTNACVRKVYTPPDSGRFTKELEKDKLLEGLNPDYLIICAGCEIVLKKVVDNTFKGNTVRNCKNFLRRARFSTSNVLITAKSWDRGFNTAGEQVRGAEKGGYIFRKVFPRKMGNKKGLPSRRSLFCAAPDD